MSRRNNTLPECFGLLETVFPMGNDGLRLTPETCFECPLKTDCLRAALKGTAGLRVHEEHIDRSYESGMIGFMERWSKKKVIDRQKNRGKPWSFRCRLLRRKPNQRDWWPGGLPAGKFEKFESITGSHIQIQFFLTWTTQHVPGEYIVKNYIKYKYFR